MIAMVACNSVLALAVLPLTPLAFEAGAARLADHAFLNNVSVADFEYNLTGGAASRNTTVYVPINKGALISNAAVNVSGKPDLSYVAIVGQGNSWDDGEGFGDGVGSADWNNDGYADLAVGWGGFTSFTATFGRVEVYYGGPQKIVGGRQNWTGFDGTGIAGYGGVITSGDYNNDNIADLVVGETWLNFGGSPHRVWIYYGSSAGLPNNASYNLSLGQTNTTLFGASLAGGIDLNNDTYDDLVVGENNYNGGAGRVIVFWGSAGQLNLSLTTTIEVAGTTQFGEVLKPLGDTDNDGYGEFAVGVPENNGQVGSVFVYEGSSNTSSVPLRFSYTAAAQEYLGYSVAGGRDVTGDGIPDLAVGTPFKDSQGAVRIFAGTGNANYTAVPTVTLPAFSGAAENLGIGLDMIRDFDGDGRADLIAGGNRWAPNVVTAPWDGRFYLYAGQVNDTGAASVFDNTNAGQQDEFGWRTNGVGDLNGDGASEFAVTMHSMMNGTFAPGGVRLYYGSTHAYPENVTVYIGTNPAWTKAGSLRGNSTASGLATQVQAYITANQASANGNGDILVPFSFNFSAGGRLNVSNFAIRYSLVVPPPNVTATAPGDGSSVLISWSLQNSDGNLYSIWSNKSGVWAIVGNASFPRTSFNDTNVSDGVRYYYYVTEWDTSVPLQSVPSPIVSAVPADVVAPNLPVNFSLQKNATAHRVTLKWALATDDTNHYEIWRRDGDLASFRLFTNVTAPATQYNDTGLDEEMNYSYQVRAVDDVGLMSGFTGILTERIPDLTPPGTPANFVAVAHPSGTAAILSFTENGGDTVSYIVLRSATGGLGTFVEVGRATGSPYNSTGLVRNQTYHFQLIAVDKADLQSPPTASVAVFTVDTQPPSAPVATGASAVNAGNAVLVNWTATGDDLAFFRIYTDASGSWQKSAEIAGSSRQGIVENLTDGVAANFRVTGVDRGGLEGPFSNVLTATPADTQKPGQPTGLTVTAPLEGAKLVLVWSPPPDLDVAGYKAFMLDPTISADWQFLATVSSGTTFTATGLKNGLAYRFQVSAFDEVPNEGAPSAFASGTPADLLAPSPPLITTASISTTTVNLRIDGTSEPNMEIQLWVRGVLQDTQTADATGNWTATARLITGDNAVYAIAVDPSPIIATSAKKSDASQTIHYTLDTTRPTVTTTSPAANAQAVPATTAFIVTFNEDIRVSSVTLTITDASGNNVAGNLVVDARNKTARFTPDQPLTAGGTYTVRFNATDTAGNAMAQQEQTFTVAGGTGPATGGTPGFESSFAALGLVIAAVALIVRRRAGQHR